MLFEVLLPSGILFSLCFSYSLIFLTFLVFHYLWDHIWAVYTRFRKMHPVPTSFARLIPRVSHLSVSSSQSIHLLPGRIVIQNLPRRTMAAKADSQTISRITQKEKELTGSNQPLKGGPTVQAQKHAGQTLTGDVISDITKGEKKLTGGERVKGGPTSAAQSVATKVSLLESNL